MTAKKTEKKKRPSIPTGEAFAVWVAAAGRCTFCNRLLLENEELSEAVKIGQLAHNVGWSENSPRGDSSLPEEERQLAENLVLACGSCHKPIDDGGVLKRYTVAEIAKRKNEHEVRIRELTAIGGDCGALVVRFVGKIRTVQPELSRETVLAATTKAGIYPRLLTGAHWRDIDLDLRNLGDPESAEDFGAMALQISKLCNRVHDGIRGDGVQRLAVFGFARIPLLVELGARLDDKVQTTIFKRHRNDQSNPWGWPEDKLTLELETTKLRSGRDLSKVALMLSMSGSINAEEITNQIDEQYSVYEIRPTSQQAPDANSVKSEQDLARFEQEVRRFLGMIEADHGKIARIALFPAVGVAAAVTVGRSLMPDVSPSFVVHDRDSDGQFFRALEVKS